MLAWSEELITDVETRKSWLWRHCRRRAIYWLLSLSCCRIAKTQNQQAPDATSFFPVGGMPTANSLAWSPLAWDAGVQQVERGALPMIDRGRYPLGNRPLQQYLGFTAGAGYGQFEHKVTAWLQNSKKRRAVREIDVSRVTAIISLWLSASSSACHGLLIIMTITPLPTKPSATKMPENWSWRTRQLLTCRCVSVMLLRSMQNTRKVSWC